MKRKGFAVGESNQGVDSFTRDAESICLSYIDDLHLDEFSLSDRFDTGNRFPVSQEFMVRAVIAERKGEAPPHPAKQYFADALHESIRRMVVMIAAKYAINCPDKQQDLAQDCFLRIWRKLDKFDADRGKFTTWVWWLCSNLMNRRYRQSQRLKERECLHSSESMDYKAVVEAKHYQSVLAGEISEAVRELCCRYPRWRKFLYALLGDPDKGIASERICVSRAAAAVGVNKTSAMQFYRQDVQPFMCERFAR